MNRNLFFLGLAPVLALGACGGSNDTTVATGDNVVVPADPMLNPEGNGTMAMGEAVAPSQRFANAVAASDAYEIRAGQIAQEKAKSPALKDFGAMMVEHHTDSTAKLKAAAGEADPAITPSPVLDAAQEADMAALQGATGDQFDAMYKAQQLAAHEKALGLIRDYAANGDSPALKAFAGAAEKVVQGHLEKLQAM